MNQNESNSYIHATCGCRSASVRRVDESWRPAQTRRPVCGTLGLESACRSWGATVMRSSPAPSTTRVTPLSQVSGAIHTHTRTAVVQPQHNTQHVAWSSSSHYSLIAQIEGEMSRCVLLCCHLSVFVLHCRRQGQHVSDLELTASLLRWQQRAAGTNRV